LNASAQEQKQSTLCALLCYDMCGQENAGGTFVKHKVRKAGIQYTDYRRSISFRKKTFSQKREDFEADHTKYVKLDVRPTNSQQQSHSLSPSHHHPEL
jgi:hypothetical protein